jgi:hypothetical protein
MSALSQHVLAILENADKEGLYLGIGKHPDLSPEEQEGPMIRRLRELAIEESTNEIVT